MREAICLNGDERMEIVVSIDYYEGSSSSVFRIDGGKVDNIVGCGCGARSRLGDID